MKNRAALVALVVSLPLVFAASTARAQDTPAPVPTDAPKPAPTDRDEIEALKKSQREFLERTLEQQRRLDELEKKALVDKDKKPEGEQGFIKWNEIVVGSSKIKFYGAIRLDVIFDDSRPSNTQTIAFIRAEDNRASGAIGARNDSNDLTIHPRLTKFGFDLDGPKIGFLGGAKVTGKIEVDFYNNGLTGQSESREALRMRHAWLKLQWGAFDILAGQTSDVISPIFPIVNNDLVMWGAGNLGDRRPQIRAEFFPEVGPGKLIAQAMVGLSGADDNQDLDAAGTTGNGYRDGETSGRPTIQCRLGYKVEVWNKQNLEFGVWGHYAWEKADTKFRNVRIFDSHAYGLDVTIPIFQDIVSVKVEIWQGRNMDDIRGGIFQGINTVKATGIDSKGGFIELGIKPVKWYSLHGGYSRDDPKNKDLSVGGRANNSIFYVANRFYFDPVEIGLDYFFWVTDYVGFKKGDDNRIQGYIAYKF